MKRIFGFLFLSLSVVGMKPDPMSTREKISLLDSLRCGLWVEKNDYVLFPNNISPAQLFTRTMPEIGIYLRQMLASTPDPESSIEAYKDFTRKDFVRKVRNKAIYLLTLEDHKNILEHVVAWELQGVKSTEKMKDLTQIFLDVLDENNWRAVNSIIGIWKTARGDYLSSPFTILQLAPVLSTPPMVDEVSIRNSSKDPKKKDIINVLKEIKAKRASKINKGALRLAPLKSNK